MDIHKCLELVAQEMNLNFTLEKKELSYDKVFSQEGFFSAIMRRADQLANFCFGYGLGVNFDQAPGTTLGVKVILDDTVPNSIRLLCAIEIICELKESSVEHNIITLDHLLYD